MKIIDNFLPQEIFVEIQNMFLSNEFPWYWCENKIYNIGEEDLSNYQMVHTFYEYNTTYSQWRIDPLIQKLNPKALVKIKANLTLGSQYNHFYGYHKDNEWGGDGCKTAIYYVNCNNGYTIFKNGDKVESVSNRMVIFNSNNLHTGTSCTDQKRRVVVNFNYF